MIRIRDKLSILSLARVSDKDRGNAGKKTEKKEKVLIFGAVFLEKCG